MAMNDGKITAILTAWKRDYFDLQIRYLLAQTVRPDKIIIYQNMDHIDLTPVCSKHGIELIHSDIDFGFFGRFTIPLALKTEFCLVLDDDVIPGKNWIRNCMLALKKHNALIGGAGRLVSPNILSTDSISDPSKHVSRPLPPAIQRFFYSNDIEGNLTIGNPPPVYTDKAVDYIMHSYFFRTEWVKYIWAQSPVTFDYGEDIHFSAACKILGGIPSVIPRQSLFDKNSWHNISYNLCHDEHASYKRPGHIMNRKKVFSFWIEKGWKTIRRP